MKPVLSEVEGNLYHEKYLNHEKHEKHEKVTKEKIHKSKNSEKDNPYNSGLYQKWQI